MTPKIKVAKHNILIIFMILIAVSSYSLQAKIMKCCDSDDDSVRKPSSQQSKLIYHYPSAFCRVTAAAVVLQKAFKLENHQFGSSG